MLLRDILKDPLIGHFSFVTINFLVINGLDL
jgi:hypothetical protein